MYNYRRWNSLGKMKERKNKIKIVTTNIIRSIYKISWKKMNIYILSFENDDQTETLQDAITTL